MGRMNGQFVNAIDCLREYRSNKNKYLPMIDHEKKYFDKESESGDINIGWDCGFIGNRPYFLECWAPPGATMSTIFLSTIGIENYSIDDLEKLLSEEGNIFHRKEGYISSDYVPQIEDSNGNIFFSFNIVVGLNDGPSLIESNSKILPFSKLNEFNGLTEKEPVKEKYGQYKFCLHERRDGAAVLFCQDPEDLSPHTEHFTISEYRFNSTEWVKVKQILAGTDTVHEFFKSFYHEDQESGGWFLADKLRGFCSDNEITYDHRRRDSIWFCLRKEEGMTNLMSFLQVIEKMMHYKIPQAVPDPKCPLPYDEYWPLIIDIKEKTVTEVHSITAIMDYCSENEMMTYTDFLGFYPM